MQFREPLREGKFIKRYKRFFADVMVDGETIVAHVPNTGSLKTCLFDGAPCIVSETNNPERKLKATLHFIQTPTSWVGVNTTLPNLLVYEAWQTQLIPEWRQFQTAQREFKISKESRLDMALAHDDEHLAKKQNLHFIEVKNVTYAIDGTAFFPDAISTRGQKHLRDLMRLKNEGCGAEIVFVIQRHDCKTFAPADTIDPEYGKLLRQAKKAGVTIRALACKIDPTSGVTLDANELALAF